MSDYDPIPPETEPAHPAASRTSEPLIAWEVQATLGLQRLPRQCLRQTGQLLQLRQCRNASQRSGEY